MIHTIHFIPPPPNTKKASDLNLEYIFEKLYVEESGQGYPRERAVPEKANKKILDEVKKVTYQDMNTILKSMAPVHRSAALRLPVCTCHN